MRGSRVVVEMLKAHGVRHIFGVPGDTSTAFYDALYDARGSIRHIMARDERSAAFMADAYARVSGQPGVCEGPSGGGLTYMLPGLAEAYGSSIPLVALTTDVPLHEEGKGALTALDQCWTILAECFEPEETGIRGAIIEKHWPNKSALAESA